MSVNLGRDWPRSSSEFDRGEADPGKFSVKLCYSVNELVKIPRANLQQQLIVLTIHELTHVFGYNELVAEKVQNYLLEGGRQLVNPAKDSIDYLQNLVTMLALTTYGAQHSLEEKDIQLCMKLGQISGVLSIIGAQIEDMQLKSEETGRPLTLSSKALKSFENIFATLEAFDGFCGNGPSEAYAVKESYTLPENPAYTIITYDDKKMTYLGNRTVVKENLEYVLKQIKRLEGHLKMNTMNY